MLEIFHYSFMIRAFEAGIIVAAISPLLGIFLVLRRYSLMADTLAHVSLAGVALGLLTKIDPVIMAVGTSTVGSLVIDKLRVSKKVYGESALALFLSGSLALAIVLISFGQGLNANLFTYLFGSIVAVRTFDVGIISILGILVIGLLLLFYKQLVFLSFDEEAAKVSGINTKFVNTMLIVLAALTVSISMRVVGILLIAALIVIPINAAIQFRKSFKTTIFIAEAISIFSMISGIFVSFYLNLAAGGSIVLIALLIFCLSLLITSKSVTLK
jgi:zinc transport system permease protein